MNEELSQAQQERRELELWAQDKMAEIGRQRTKLIGKPIQKLLDYGRMDLANYPQYARIYFEKVLALDATNQEAIEALAEIDAVLARKASPKLVKAPRVETREERAKRERRWLLSVGAGIAAVVFLIGLIASGTAGVAPYIAIIALAAFFCVWLLIHAS